MQTNEWDRRLGSSTQTNGNGHLPPGHRIVHAASGKLVVEIVGEHDLASHNTIRDLFLRLVAAKDLLVVDLSEATFIDSSFLRVFDHRQQTRGGGGLPAPLAGRYGPDR